MAGEVGHLKVGKQEPVTIIMLLLLPQVVGARRGDLHAISLGFDAVDDVSPQP